MDPIHNVPNITLRGLNIPNITVNGTGIPLIRDQVIGVNNTYIADIRNVNIHETRNWLVNPPQAVPIAVPVTVNAGTPIVNMPGCVTVHKENAKKDPSSNKNLVNDDPKGRLRCVMLVCLITNHLTMTIENYFGRQLIQNLMRLMRV